MQTQRGGFRVSRRPSFRGALYTLLCAIISYASDALINIGTAPREFAFPKEKNKPKKEINTMSGSNNTNSNQALVPEAREALNRFKMEAAEEVGVNLKPGYNGDLTSREAGSVGGQMVKKMIQSYENNMK